MPVDLIDISKSGVMSSSKALKTAGHNIANVHTEGFSRQRPELIAANPIAEGNLVFGSGSEVRSVKRIHDQYLETKLNQALSDHSFHTNRYQQLSGLDDIFSEINVEGLARIMKKFFNSFRELATQPENQSLRSLVRDSAIILIREINSKTNQLNQTVGDINQIFDQTTEDINLLTKNIARLNVKITEIEKANGETGDLRDERDTQLRNLSEIIETSNYLDKEGRFIVSAKGLGTLVSGSEVQVITTRNAANRESEIVNHFPFTKNLYIGDQEINSKFRNGKIAALTKVRDNEVLKMKKILDSVTFQLVSITNNIHQKGYVGKSISEENLQDSNFSNKVTNINFFKPIEEEINASSKIDLSDEIKEDSLNICSALEPNSMGDNRIALAISRIGTSKLLDGQTRTIEEKYLESIGTLSLSTSKAKMDTEQTEGILAQLKAVKERISGVNLDEETSNLIRLQHSYDASARVMKVANETLNEILHMGSR